MRTKSRTIPLGESLSDFCRQLELPITGLQIRRLKDQARRLFNARLSVHYVEHLQTDPSPRGQSRQVRQEAGQNLLIASRYELWTTTQRNHEASDLEAAAEPTAKPAVRRGTKTSAPQTSAQSGAAQRGAKQTAMAVEVALPSGVTLSAELYEEVTHRPVPVDIGALGLLRGSPLRLDVYTWLTYRMSYLRKPVVVTWEQLRFQFGTQVSTPARLPALPRGLLRGAAVGAGHLPGGEGG